MCEGPVFVGRVRSGSARQISDWVFLIFTTAPSSQPECPEPASYGSPNLSDNAIGDEGAERLAQALVANASLSILDLGYNSRIGRRGVEAVAVALEQNRALTSVALRHSGSDSDGLDRVATLLQGNRRVRVLTVEASAPRTEPGRLALSCTSLAGRAVAVITCARADTVGALRKAIGAELQIPPGQLRLLMPGGELLDDGAVAASLVVRGAPNVSVSMPSRSGYRGAIPGMCAPMVRRRPRSARCATVFRRRDGSCPSDRGRLQLGMGVQEHSLEAARMRVP
ncbi:unnamed protein product [Prorocentrum cordatum]|uniref:Ubiquitin-like domain-containing protein n=1 Tax=Prorocentrum cordatum TaxID=2364126 RepID=A0ABN9TKC1_9DINO|nr:unnamed protein product [Polarella glacialis]